MKHLGILIMLTALSACAGGLGITRIGDTISQSGTLECAERTSSAETPIVGTEADPLRCGPQTQAIPSL